jgi:hypothetical protein
VWCNFDETYRFYLYLCAARIAAGREGLDALMATSAFTEDIGVFFIGDGVFQLLANSSRRPSWRVITSRPLKFFRFTISKPVGSAPARSRARPE